MTCPQCARENPDDSKFCGGCGARLERRCPGCQTANPPTNKFCSECGARLVAAAGPAPAPPAPAPAPVPASAPPPAAPERFASPQTYTPRHLAEKILTSRGAMEGERKQVTVLFTDVSGFTAMSSHLDPEEVHGIMDRCFEIILGHVHRYEGTINQFLGDGVMALFGAPIAHEDHPHRALRAALAIQEGLGPLREELRRTHGVDFRVRIGVNTGLVVVGAIGKDLRMDYTAIGDTTNLASRVLNIAQPGQVAISRGTHRLTEGYFEFEDLGEFTVKGKTEPVRVYAVRRELHGRTRLEVSRSRGLTPLVGRTAELERLRAAYRNVAAGRGTIVLLTGEPGVGKSRVLYEFVHQINDPGVRELKAACVSHGRQMPYHPILELLRHHLEIGADAGPEEIRARVSERVRHLGADGDEPAIPLAHLLGAPAPADFLARLEPAQLKERTFRVASRLLLEAAGVAPLILVVENIRWIDASSEEFLAYLARALPGHRVLLLLTARSGVDIAWLGASPVERIAVEGLDAGQVAEMVSALLGAAELSADLLATLTGRSEGNPLYLEEIVRQLKDTGAITVEDGRARLASANVTIPETINDIITARVDRLEEPLRQTLRLAAVVGRQFAVQLLTRLLQEPDSAVLEHLDGLRGLDFVYRVEQLLYSFKHALTQEVVYSSLLERRRRLYHAAVGAGLEELYAGRLEEIVELLAHHFARSTETEKAVDYAILAAEKAQQKWAHAEALAHFDAAVKRLETMPDTEDNRVRRIDVVVKQAEIKFALGRQAEHVQALEAIRDLVETTPDPRRRAAWYYWAGFLHSLTGARPDVSIGYCRRAVEIADAAGLDDIRPYAECALAHVYLTAGDLRASLEAGERALARFEERGNAWWACRALWALSPAANGLGEWERGLTYCRRALALGQQVDDLRLKVSGWWRTGSTHIQRGDAEPGLACCQAALDLSPIPFDAAMIRAVRGYGLVKSGKVTEGTAEIAEAVAWFERSNLRYTRSLFSLWLAESCLLLGERRRARGLLEEILAMASVGYRHLEGVAYRLLGESLLDDDPLAAAAHLQTATSILEEIGARNELAKTWLAQALLDQRGGRCAEARARLAASLAVFEEVGTADGPPRVRAALAALDAASAA